MANNHPTNQAPPVEEISPDGNPTGQVQAAPRSTRNQQQQQQQKPVQSIEDLPVVDEGQQQQQVEQEPVLDLSAFLQAKGDSNTVIEQQQAQQKVGEDKNKLQVTPPAQQQQQQQQVQQQQRDPNARDYSEIDEADRDLFKRMPNESFNKLKPIYLEHRKTKAEVEALKKSLEDAKKGQLPDNYYSHPQAFMLTPEFNQAATNVQQYEQIANHWNQQLQSVREGAKEIEFLGYNQVTNQFYKQKVPANVETEQQLISYINFANQNVVKAQAQLEVVRQTYAGKHQEATNGVNNLRQQYFRQLQNNQQLEPVIQQHINNLPAAFRSDPLARVLAESLTMNQFLAQQLMNGNGQQQSRQQQPRRQGPSGEEIAGGGPTPQKGNGKQEKEVTVDDFEAVKQGL